MRKLQLFKAPDQSIDSKNADTLMNSFASGTFDPGHASARFSNPAVSRQTGYFQRINGICYVYIEITPDIDGGGATVSFSAGDTLNLPFLSISPASYTNQDLVAFQQMVLQNQSTRASFADNTIYTDPVTGTSKIYIGTAQAAAATTFGISGIYILRN